MYPVELKTDRLTLREIAEEHIPAIYAYYDEPVVQKFYAWEPPDTLDAYRELLTNERLSHGSGRETYLLGIFNDAELVGEIGLQIEEPEHKRAQLWYIIDANSREQGYAVEAAGAIIQFGFETLGLHRIYATTHPDNTASQRVLAKCQFEYEGCLRDYKFIRGEWRDSLMYARIAGE